MSDLTATLQERIARLFVEVVAETNPTVSQLLREKLDIVERSEATSLATLSSLSAEGNTALEGLVKRAAGHELVVAEMDAKLVDVQWRARKTGGIVMVNAVGKSRLVRTGDTFSELLERFCRKNLSSEVVQSLLQYAHVWPSLTTHPTNPMSFQYTRAGLSLDKLLAEPTTTTSKITSALRQIRDTPMQYDVDPQSNAKLIKKTPLLEIQEMLLILEVLYDSVVGPQRRLRDALDRFGYQDVKTSEPLLNMNVWGAGDGDGNPNMDAPWLLLQVRTLREAISKRYIADLQHPSVDLSEQFAEFTAAKEKVIATLQQQSHRDAAHLTSDIDALDLLLNRATEKADGASSATIGKARDHLRELQIKSRTFGLHFAGTDVRHNSVDIMEVASDLISFVGVMPAKQFLALSPVEQEAVIRPLFADQEKRTRVAQTNEALIKEKWSTVGSRVFLRMRVMAANPDMFQKLIIAETRSAANALAALLLLRYAGNIVAEKGAKLSIVPLFESREDLDAAPQTFHTLATDPTFGLHIRSVGCFIAMIAKSDTTRLSGPGVQGQQEETVARIMCVCPESYGGGFQMHVFMGGGDDQMRGGGRIVETPHVLMLAANRLGAVTPSRFAMTIQGLQMQLVFGSRLLSEHFLEAFAAQQMLAAARLQGHIRYRPVPAICNRKSVDFAARQFFHSAMNYYEYYIGQPDGNAAEQARRKTIVDYLNGFPSTIITSGNKSSRPMARKKSNDPLQGRAISLDQLSKHEGAYVTSTLGVTEALRLMMNAPHTGRPEFHGMPMCPIRHAYLANKSFRDFVRMQAVVLFQKDYDMSWSYRGGRPTAVEHTQLAEQCRAALAKGVPAAPRQFLAYMEQQDIAEAQLLSQAITGLPSQDPSIQAALLVGWPDLAGKMAARARQSVLAQVWVHQAVDSLNQNGTHPADRDALLGYFGYVGVNPRFATPSFSLTMTDPQKEGGWKGSVGYAQVSKYIVVPTWALTSPKGKL